MARGEVSDADRQLILAVEARGVEVSPAQLERWRGAGLIPRNLRQGAGRGRGSSSRAPEGLDDYVAALGSITRQGRSQDDAVLCLFGAGIFRGDDADSSDPVWAAHDRSLRRALSRFVDTKIVELRLVVDAAKNSRSSDEIVDRVFTELESIVSNRKLRGQMAAREDVSRKLGISIEDLSIEEIRSERIQTLAYESRGVVGFASAFPGVAQVGGSS